jgi:hypothetical protein
VTETTELKLRRRAIYTGMRPFFDDAELMAALKLWQTHFSQTPKFAYSAFLSACCNTSELKQQRSNILSGILQAMNLPERELLNDPFDASSPPVANVIHNNIDSKTVVFMSFITTLLAKVSTAEALLIRAALIKNSASLAMDKRHQFSLQQWLSNKAEQLEHAYDIDVMRKLVNFSYIAMCECFGPVKADMVLAQTIKQTETVAQQHHVKLHDFL